MNSEKGERIKDFMLIAFSSYIFLYYPKIALIQVLWHIYIYLHSKIGMNNLKQYYHFFNENINEFIQFYLLICENNPLLLNYVDDFDEDLKNNDFQDVNLNPSEIIKYEKKIEEKYEEKYLKKFKDFPNKFIFDETELTQEIDERDNIEFEFEKKRSMSICAIQQELSKINGLNVLTHLNDNKIQRLLEWFDLAEDYEDNPESVNIQELEKQVIEHKNKLLKQLTELETMTITEEEISVNARDIIINNKLDKFIDNYILEYTPLGNIYMRFNNNKKSFEYFSNNSIPYRYLEPVGRKYVMTYWCKPIFVDMDNELKKAEEIYDKKKEEDLKKAEENNKKFNPKNVLVKLKDYNKNTKENSIRPMKNRSDNNSILSDQIKNNLPDVNKKSEKIFLKEKANRYTWEGRLTDFCPLKKIDRKVIDKKLNMTYAEFKKFQQESQNKK
jgi:hypothetical protein